MQREDPKITPLLPVGKLDSQGRITLDLTIPYSELKLTAVLGEGAYGTVYKGQWKSSEVAVKKLKIQKFSPSAREEFLQEAQIMFQLGNESDHIVRLKKICLESPNYSLVMELMPKGSLYDLLHNNQEIPWLIRYRIALDLAYGLETLHGYHILHRDLKSLNVLLDDRLRAKLSDFGLAKIKSEISSQSARGEAGTVRWMAPELFKRGAKASPASDIYSLGVVLWELVSRVIPFADGVNNDVVIRWLETGEKETIPEECPALLNTLISDCWETPGKRPAASKVVERLKPLLESKAEIAKPEELSAGESLAAPLSLLSVVPKSAAYAAGVESKDSPLNLENPPQNPFVMIPVEVKEEKMSSEEIKRLLPLQDLLVTACEEGDLKTVQQHILKGAKPFLSNWKDIHPLGAAVWGMNIELVNYLLKQMANSSVSMSWIQCQEHNMKYYKEVFMIENFRAKVFGDWLRIFNKAESSIFMRDFLLKRCNETWEHDLQLNTWEKLKKFLSNNSATISTAGHGDFIKRASDFYVIEGRLNQLREKIKESITPKKSVPARRFIPSFVRNLELINQGSEFTEKNEQLKNQQAEIAWREEETKKELVQRHEPALPSQNSFLMMPKPKSATPTPVDAKALEQLLVFVVEGEQDQAEALIQKNPQLLLAASEVKDLSGRVFKKITAFQYALWALDWHMWKMILKYLPLESAAQQLSELESKGTEHGKHFSLQPLINALQMYVDNAVSVWKNDDRALRHWCGVVGEAQRKIPAHVVNEYCREDRSFDPCPVFTEEKLPRVRTSKFFSNEDWFTASRSCKVYVYPVGYIRETGMDCAMSPIPANADIDLRALQSLWKVRTQQMELLKSELMAVSHSQRAGVDAKALEQARRKVEVKQQPVQAPQSNPFAVMPAPKPAAKAKAMGKKKSEKYTPLYGRSPDEDDNAKCRLS